MNISLRDVIHLRPDRYFSNPQVRSQLTERPGAPELPALANLDPLPLSDESGLADFRVIFYARFALRWARFSYQGYKIC